MPRRYVIAIAGGVRKRPGRTENNNTREPTLVERGRSEPRAATAITTSTLVGLPDSRPTGATGALRLGPKLGNDRAG